MTRLIDIFAPIEQEGTEAIVQSWYIKVGEFVAEGDPLVELETDKVAVEVPAPVSGTLIEIAIIADEAVKPGGLLGRLQSGSEKSDTPPAQEEKKPAKPAAAAAKAVNEDISHEYRLSPAVRRLLLEHDLIPSLITGTGKAGRLTRYDVLEFLETEDGVSAPSSNGPSTQIPHDNMRRRIAEHMSKSVQVAPHVTAVFEADFSAVIAHRAAHKEEYAKQGVKLTYMAYIIAACAEAMKAAPTVNSRWHDDFLEVFDDINIGIGVALGDKGLIVPVVHQTQSRSHFEIAEELHHLTEKARDGKLAQDDVRGGTFTISNHGASGSLVASPIIINQPQSAIFGVGKLEKRAVVRTVDGVDTVQIKPMSFVSLTIDHRSLDGAQTNAWLTRFIEVIESWPEV